MKKHLSLATFQSAQYVLIIKLVEKLLKTKPMLFNVVQ